MYYDHGISGWGWVGMSIGMVLFWGLLIAMILLFVRAMSRVPDHHHRSSISSAEQMLAEQFARGEIDEDDYRKRLKILQASG